MKAHQKMLLFTCERSLQDFYVIVNNLKVFFLFYIFIIYIFPIVDLLFNAYCPRLETAGPRSSCCSRVISSGWLRAHRAATVISWGWMIDDSSLNSFMKCDQQQVLGTLQLLDDLQLVHCKTVDQLKVIQQTEMA